MEGIIGVDGINKVARMGNGGAGSNMPTAASRLGGPGTQVTHSQGAEKANWRLEALMAIVGFSSCSLEMESLLSCSPSAPQF